MTRIVADDTTLATFLGHLSCRAPFLREDGLSGIRHASAGRHRQRPDPLKHRPEQASGQMALRQQEPVIARVFYQPAAGLDEALLQGQRPAVDPCR